MWGTTKRALYKYTYLYNRLQTLHHPTSSTDRLTAVSSHWSLQFCVPVAISVCEFNFKTNLAGSSLNTVVPWCRAAFQYGVKMADGRKTRRTGPKDEKKELDREWQKIQNIIAKRKSNDTGGDGGSSPKAARYWYESVILSVYINVNFVVCVNR